MSDDNEAEELVDEQARREATERRQARVADTDQEALAHQRRAEKAAYLREKLEERVAAEEDDGT